MFLDASAIVAILAREPDADHLAKAIDDAKSPLIVSPLAVFEATTGLAGAKSNKRPLTRESIEAAHAVVTAFLEANSVKQILVGADIGRAALEAVARFGRAVGHPADLNFGDCFAYACARRYRVPLLLKGNDFPQTDVNENVHGAQREQGGSG